MKTCRHASWLGLTHASNKSSEPTRIYDTGRLRQLLADMGSPNTRRPQMVLSIGTNTKRIIMASLLAGNEYVLRSNERSPYRLFVERLRNTEDPPMLLADYTPDFLTYGEKVLNCHDLSFHELDLSMELSEAHDMILTRLLFPFAHMILLFADDFGGLEGVYRLLKNWCKQRATSTASWDARASLEVVITVPARQDVEGEEVRTFHKKLRGIEIHQHFSQVHVQRTGRAHAKQHLQVLRAISTGLETARKRRESVGLHFSSSHLEFQFSQCVRHVTSSKEAFGFIAASRVLRPVPQSFDQRIVHLLELALDRGNFSDKLSRSFDEIARFIASSLILDAYPASAHRGSPNPRSDNIQLIS